MNRGPVTRRPLTALLALCLGGCFLNPCSTPSIPTDECSMPAAGQVSAVQIGSAVTSTDDYTGLGAAGNAPFTALSDGDMATYVTGGQGLHMLVLRLRVTGAAPPTCLSQTTTITADDGTVLGTFSAPIVTYAQSDGSRTTKGIPMPGYFPVTVIVNTVLGDVGAGPSVKRTLLTGPPTCGSTLNCAAQCAAGDMACVRGCGSRLGSDEQSSLVAYQSCLWSSCYVDPTRVDAGEGGDGGSGDGGTDAGSAVDGGSGRDGGLGASNACATPMSGECVACRAAAVNTLYCCYESNGQKSCTSGISDGPPCGACAALKARCEP